MDRSCLYCESRFEAKRDSRLFCSDACRSRYNRENYLVCFYCGSVAQSRDHIYPHSARQGERRIFEGQETVRACAECNATVGDCFPNDLPARIYCLADRIYVRYKLDRGTPEWDDDELAELGPNLRSAVEQKIRNQRRAAQRWLHVMAVASRVAELVADR